MRFLPGLLLVLFPFAWRPLMSDWQEQRALYWDHRWRILGLSILGIAAFNSLAYWGLRTTTATNGILLQSIIPILIVLFCVLFDKQSLWSLQALGLAVSFVGVLTPVFLWESMAGMPALWTWKSIGALLYIGIFPSVLAYLLCNYGIAKAGAAKAGQFVHLMPVFGTILSMLLLGERLQAYHVAGIAAIVLGIMLWPPLLTRPDIAP